MIKRRFYKVEHEDKDGNDNSDSSSSSSDSEVEAESAKEESENEAVADDVQSCSSSSGYESEDGSADEIDADVPGYKSEDSSADEVDVDVPVSLIDDDVPHSEKNRSNLNSIQMPPKGSAGMLEMQTNIEAEEDSFPSDAEDCVLKCKSVFRCRLCPRIVCLTDETIRAHLKSKRHARSEKLMKEGRLKLMLNSDGEIEENEETHAERHARMMALAEVESKKKNKGRQRQRKRLMKKKTESNASAGKAKPSTEKPTKKRRKRDN